MPRLSNLPLRARTILLFLIGSLVPLALAGLAASAKIESHLVDEILADQRRLITQIQLDLDSEFAWFRGQLETLSSQVPLESLAAEPSRETLESFLDYHNLFHRVSLFDSDGRMVARASRSAIEESSTELPPALKDAFGAALKGKSQQAPVPAADSGVVELALLAPVPSLRQDRPPVGVAVAIVRKQGAEIQDIVDGWKFASETYVYLTTPAWDVVASAGTLPGRTLRKLKVEAPSGSAGPVVAGVGRLLGRDDVIATAALPDHGLVAVVGRPYAEVSRTLNELLWAVSFYVLIGVLLALLLGVLLSRALVAPILSLTAGIQRVAQGEVAHRLPVERGDELGGAALAFNEMASQLQKGRLLEELWQERRGGPPGSS